MHTRLLNIILTEGVENVHRFPEILKEAKMALGLLILNLSVHSCELYKFVRFDRNTECSKGIFYTLGYDSGLP